jgi:hypothetical protein
MKVICFKLSKDQPTRTKSVEVVYDFFIPEEDCTLLITYTEPVPNTIPLYLFGLGDDNVFPSFDKTAPTIYWKELPISPIFVLKGENFNFTCLNGKCIPLHLPSFRAEALQSIPALVAVSPPEDRGLHNNSPLSKKESMSFDDCLKECSHQKPKNILEMVKDKERVLKNSEIFWSSFFFILLFCLFILVLYYIFSKHG